MLVYEVNHQPGVPLDDVHLQQPKRAQLPEKKHACQFTLRCPDKFRKMYQRMSSYVSITHLPYLTTAYISVTTFHPAQQQGKDEVYSNDAP